MQFNPNIIMSFSIVFQYKNLKFILTFFIHFLKIFLQTFLISTQNYILSYNVFIFHWSPSYDHFIDTFTWDCCNFWDWNLIFQL